MTQPKDCSENLMHFDSESSTEYLVTAKKS